jgi:hypothetical protein
MRHYGRKDYAVKTPTMLIHARKIVITLWLIFAVGLHALIESPTTTAQASQLSQLNRANPYELINSVRSVLGDHYAKQFGETWRKPDLRYFNTLRYPGVVRCGDYYLRKGNHYYCSDTQSGQVLIDDALVWQEWYGYGAGGVLYSIVHEESGHALSDRLGQPLGEALADCFGGRAVRILGNKGLLKSGELDVVLRAAEDSGDDKYSVPSGEGIHGTGKERRERVWTGFYYSSVDECINKYGLPAWPSLRRGSSGPAVKALQYLLYAHGFGNTVGAVDSIFGPRVEQAVLAFQRSKGLVADGIAGPKTLGRLVVPASFRSQGPAVKALQTLLNKYRFGLAVDGSHQLLSNQAMHNFQVTRGLHESYSADALTWQALFGGKP